MNDIVWSWKKFTNLTLDELYKILKVRQEVFVLEQKCFYVDTDDKDYHSFHLMGWCRDQLVVYLRVILPPDNSKVIYIGRVLTIVSMRNKGLAKLLMKYALEKIATDFSAYPIHLAAQIHLQAFYESFGFRVTSEPYDEDGIMHIDMVKECKS